ncbi:CcmD family protein [Chitinophagaceae bacterium MMS25-I14]
MRKVSVLTTLILLLTTLVTNAQDAQPEMADTMRSNGKIYVVVLVLATIFAGIIAFLVSLERKIKKLEKNN